MFSRKIIILPALLAFSLVAGYGCEQDDDDNSGSTPVPMGSDSQMTPGLSLAGTVVADQRFSTLKTALEKADLVSVLEQGEYTIFAPTNDAFAEIPNEALNALLNDKPALTRVLLYHVVPGRLKAEKVLATSELKTANDGFLKPAVKDGEGYINNAKILQTDLEAKNGVIHVINKVLLPPAQ